LLFERDAAVSSDFAVGEARRNITLNRAAWLPAFGELHFRFDRGCAIGEVRIAGGSSPQGSSAALRSHPEPSEEWRAAPRTRTSRRTRGAMTEVLQGASDERSEEWRALQDSNLRPPGS
jgi:hypothetical protein